LKPRCHLTGGGIKPPNGAAVKSGGTERLGKVSDPLQNEPKQSLRMVKTGEGAIPELVLLMEVRIFIM